MAADLGLIVDAAERDAREVPAERIGDRTPQRCFADSRRADEAQDRRFESRACELPHGHKFEDALLDLRQPVVIAIQCVPGLDQVVCVFGLVGPGQVEQPI